MRRLASSCLVAVVIVGPAATWAQESKPVPKDSVRLFVPGCSKGYMFTTGPRLTDQPGSSQLPEGMHLRMNGPKKLMNEIKQHEGTTIEITGLVKRDQLSPGGMKVGPVRISPGVASGGAGSMPGPASGQLSIDVEGWRSMPGNCPR
jgi:hypothetical protein